MLNQLRNAMILLLVSTSCFAFGWQCFSRNPLGCTTWRYTTPHGWLIENDHGAITYVPDEQHLWMK